MYESKYSRYITKSQSRFANASDIIRVSSPLVNADGVRTAGIPLFGKGGRVYVDGSDGHSIVIGPTGCKKTRTTVFPTVCSIIDAGESAVITDPKGEIFRKTADRAKKKANVIVINFRDPSKSMCWNPLAQAKKFLIEGRENECAQSINDFVDSIADPALKCTVDRYWADTSKGYLNGVAQCLVASVPLEYCNLKNLLPMCYEDSREKLHLLLNSMDQTSSAAFGLHAVLDLEAERTRSCVYGTLLAMLTPFTQNSNLLELLSGNSIDIESIGNTQTIVYLIYPDEKNSLNFLINAFFTQCYETLVSISDYKHGGKLPVRVNFVLDEFSNLPVISNFENRISEARSRNIRYFLFIQSYNQLQQKYKEGAETILSNCNNWICFSSKEIEFLEKLSAICGKEVDYNGIEHPLVSPFDMQYLEKKQESAQALIIKQGQYPFVSELPDIDYINEYKGYKECSYSDIKMTDCGKYISITEWINGIQHGKFLFPFHEKHHNKHMDLDDLF